jgi:hypothetical protein
MNFTQKSPKKHECLLCDYITCSLKDFNKHIMTSKHLNKSNLNVLEQKNPKNPQTFSCKNCNKCYKARNSLWYHEQKCNYEKKTENDKTENDKTENENIEVENDITDKDLIVMLIKQNSELLKETSEFKNLILEIVKKDTTTNNNIITNTNSHNKAFNLNFFLNETCKNAMNIMDFVESIQFQLSDLERVGEVGYIEGISNIIVKNLKALDITQRPVHCTDKKRETLYVKDDNKWEKDDENTKMHKMIRKVQDKNFRMIKKFKEKYPDYHKPSSKQSDVYNNIIIESMGGRGDNDYEKEEKIIKKVSKEVLVEK